MSLELKISQKLSQSLVMTPQLQQAIKLLQLGRQEYLDVIQKEILENPLLDDSISEDLIKKTNSLKENLEQESSSHWEKVKKNTLRDSPSRSSLIDSISYEENSLDSHLYEQLRTSDILESKRHIAINIIGDLDQNGYLSSSITELANLLQEEEEEVLEVLKLIQEFDPVGIASRDLKECLSIQLIEKGLSNSLSYKIVSKHLKKLENKNYNLIAKEENVALEDIYSAIKLIQTLEPRPARPFFSDSPVYITPDVYVKKVEDEYLVYLNESGLPSLKINTEYQNYINKGNPNEKEYLQEKTRSALWLIKSIEQRQQTILKVTESIMKFQHEFLEQGVSKLKPLVLREIAEDVSMHESTISRVTTNKFVHTSWGVFELKYFFSSGIKSGNSEISSESVKERIRQIISEEKKERPFSDQDLVNILKKEEIKIARRTVAKYREAMGILSSSRRKKLF